jgi:hypothetical protein
MAFTKNTHDIVVGVLTSAAARVVFCPVLLLQTLRPGGTGGSTAGRCFQSIMDTLHPLNGIDD